MKNYLLILAAGASLAACTSTNNGLGDIADNSTVRAGAIGAAGGAAIGAVVPGLSTAEGAAIGAAAGVIADATGVLRDRNGRTAGGYGGSGWAEIDSTVRNDVALQQRVIARYDTNRDNELDRSEGQLASRDLRRLMDSDNNGNISNDEYNRNRDYALRNI
jgi:hypothetical protein